MSASNLAYPTAARAEQRHDFKGIKIVLDPGHGGRDAGALAPNGLTEKNINLSVAKHLGNLLKKAGAHVILTRGSDRFVSLPGRVSIANRAKADLFVAVHQNSSPRAGAMGTETYYHHNSAAKISKFVQSELLRHLKYPNRGSRKAGFHVIKNTKMPSILTEAAFMSNKREAERLNRSDYRQKQALAIFNGLKKRYNVVDKLESPKPLVEKVVEPIKEKVAESAEPVTEPAAEVIGQAKEANDENPKPAVEPGIDEEARGSAKLKVEFKDNIGFTAGEKHEPKVHIANASAKDEIITVRNVGNSSSTPKVVFRDLIGNEVVEVRPFIGANNNYSFYPKNIAGEDFVGTIDVIEPAGEVNAGLSAGLVAE